MTKRLGKLIILISVVLLIAILGISCSSNINLDLNGYIKVTYNCMGGNIDKLPERVLYAKPNSLLVEPKGSVGFVEAKRANYNLVGWYTSYTQGEYELAENGEFVYIDMYIENAQGEYVSLIKYVQADDGEYVRITLPGDQYIFEFFNPENEEHKTLPRFNAQIKYEEYDELNNAHEGLSRYTKEKQYIWYDEQNPDHQKELRYNSTLYFDEADKWDFKNDRTSLDDIVLYARWARNLSINWIYNNGTDTKVTFQNGVLGVVIDRGKLLPTTTIIPRKSGHTFTYWYKDADATQKWDFNNEVFPEDNSITEINLYAGYIEGNYTRLTNASDLRNLKSDGKYLLVSNISLSPSDIGSGMVQDSVFMGEFNGNGHIISEMDINAVNTIKTGVPRYFGFFSKIQGATIKNLTIQGEIKIMSNSTSPLYLGAIAGLDIGGSIIENCNINIQIYSQTQSQSTVYAGAYLGAKGTGKDSTTIIRGSFNEGYASGITETDKVIAD